MTPFRFGLEKVLAWRRLQLQMKEVRFQQAAAALADLDRARAALEAEALKVEAQVRQLAPLAGSDLAALSGFRVHVRKKTARLAARRAESARQLEAQKASMLEARRRCQLLERLRERRLAEWRAAADRELEALAADSHLAALARRPVRPEDSL